MSLYLFLKGLDTDLIIFSLLFKQLISFLFLFFVLLFQCTQSRIYNKICLSE